MANDGYMGKILRVDLTSGKISTIDTSKYKKYGGGHGMGTAVFFDECENPAVSGLDPKNVVTLMTSPLSGTVAPAASGRTELQGIGAIGYPINWFTRSNFGGRFSSMLKFAGWDGIVIKGKAKEPCWLDIRNDKVTIQSAKGIWGLDTYETQEEIWRRVRETAGTYENGWYTLEKGRDTGSTTFDPTVLAIGPIGETLSPMACLVHEGGNGAGQGGFGAVFGSKNLKAVSVIGTGEVAPADMKALVDTRLWSQQFGPNGHPDEPMKGGGSMFSGKAGSGGAFGPKRQESGPYGCTACHKCCRRRWKSGIANASDCVDFFFISFADTEVHGEITQNTLDATDMAQRRGFNVYQLEGTLLWLRALAKQGLLGPGKAVDTDLEVEKHWGTAELSQALMTKIEKQEDIGKYLHMGLAQGADAMGRYKEDTASGILPIQAWGYPQHYDARTEVEWGYASLIGDRDCNEHDLNGLVFWTPSGAALMGGQPPYTAEQLAKAMESKGGPWADPKMVDYSDEGIYSDSMAKLVAWHRHYTRYYKQSMLFCDWSYSDILNPYTDDWVGITGEIEPRICNAVTGEKISYEDGLKLGYKIWTFDRAIWCLQGRTAEMEEFTEYNYKQPAVPGYTSYEMPYVMPVFDDGEWKFKSVAGRVLDREKFNGWKQKFYKLEGWDTNGVPTRETLEKLDLKNVADALQKAGKLS